MMCLASAMTFNAPLSSIILLTICMYNVGAQTLMVIGSTINDVDTPLSVDPDRSTRVCSPGTESCTSVGYVIIPSIAATTRQLSLTHMLQTSFNVVGGVTLVHSPFTETLVPFAGVVDTTSTNKVATVLLQIANDGTRNDTTLFSGNAIDITGASNFTTDVNQNTTEVDRLLGSNSLEFEPQAKTTRSATVGTLGNATVLSVEEGFWQERLSVALFIYVSPFIIIIGTLGNSVSIITFQHRHFRYTYVHWIRLDRLIRAERRTPE